MWCVSVISSISKKWFCGPNEKLSNELSDRLVCDIYIENNTWARGDMEFLFECSTRYLTSERSERVSYSVEHEDNN